MVDLKITKLYRSDFEAPQTTISGYDVLLFLIINRFKLQQFKINPFPKMDQ